MAKFPIATLSIFLLMLTGPLRAATSVSSVYNEEEDEYTTEGYATVDAPVATTRSIAGRFHEYRNWSLTGINGDAENSRKFISLIRDIVYRKDQEAEHFTVYYDVDLIFPFNRSDETLKFSISQRNYSNGLLRSFQVSLSEDSMVINKFQIIIAVDEAPDGRSVISFSSSFQLASIFAIFFSLRRYRQNVEWRILRIIENLNLYAEKIAEE